MLAPAVPAGMRIVATSGTSEPMIAFRKVPSAVWVDVKLLP